MTRVRRLLERSRQTLIERSSRFPLLDRYRATVADLLGAPASPPQTHSSPEALASLCAGVSLRDLNLVDSLLAQLEKMEADEDDPDALSQLYKLDHLATRLRRNAENLRVLAGRDAGEGSEEPTSLVDVIRAAMSSIEQYDRVEIGTVAPLGVVGIAADDVGRLLAELLDNATLQSPPTSSVTVSAHLTEHGNVLLRVIDAGIGLPPERLDTLNKRLSEAPAIGRETVQHMGIAVVRRLAARHEIRVWLSRRTPHGTVASVLLPTGLVQEAPRPATPGAGGAKHTAGTRTPADTGPSKRPGAPAPTDEGDAGHESRSGAHEASAEAGSAPQKRSHIGAALPKRAASGGATLPKREPRSTGNESTAGRSTEETGDDGATTANGLPRRVPQSLKAASAGRQEAEAEGRSEEEQRAGRAQLLSDLDDFTAGEQAARESGQETAGAAGEDAPPAASPEDFASAPELGRASGEYAERSDSTPPAWPTTDQPAYPDTTTREGTDDPAGTTSPNHDATAEESTNLSTSDAATAGSDEDGSTTNSAEGPQQ